MLSRVRRIAAKQRPARLDLIPKLWTQLLANQAPASTSNWVPLSPRRLQGMLPQRIARAPALRSGLAATRRLPTTQRRGFLPPQYSDRKILDDKFPDRIQLSDAEDPEVNGGYINPPRIKRQFRDPYGDWWDKQERRNFGEPMHEDNDILGMFSPHEYTWTTTGPALIMFGTFVATFLGVCGVVYLCYPDKPAYPREFEGGLERELGGPGARRARMPGDPDP
ncbi:hypothetical protein CDD83_1352 [Cordyceps sp. RAO-2017]|nr:hypothetical protein CDD83_1352 [Cordyceps sp. RAO-2017]